MADRQNESTNHYQRLGIQPTASPQQIRRAYRDLSKLCHPDTTDLPAAIAKEQFQALNEAYATLSAPDKRLAYDYSIGYSRVAVMQAPTYLNRPANERSRYESSSAYLDPTDRPLSAGELFALFILGITFVCCLMLVLAISFTQGKLVQASSSSIGLIEGTPVLPTEPIEKIDPIVPSGTILPPSETTQASESIPASQINHAIMTEPLQPLSPPAPVLSPP